MQIEYELRLEALGAQALRDLLSDRVALRRVAPARLDDARMRGIAEATVAELVAREATAADAPAPSKPSRPWAQVFVGHGLNGRRRVWAWRPMSDNPASVIDAASKTSPRALARIAPT